MLQIPIKTFVKNITKTPFILHNNDYASMLRYFDFGLMHCFLFYINPLLEIKPIKKINGNYSGVSNIETKFINFILPFFYTKSTYVDYTHFLTIFFKIFLAISVIICFVLIRFIEKQFLIKEEIAIFGIFVFYKETLLIICYILFFILQLKIFFFFFFIVVFKKNFLVFTFFYFWLVANTAVSIILSEYRFLYTTNCIFFCVFLTPTQIFFFFFIIYFILEFIVCIEYKLYILYLWHTRDLVFYKKKFKRNKSYTVAYDFKPDVDERLMFLQAEKPIFIHIFREKFIDVIALLIFIHK